jgi:hypothetical protein
MTLKSLSDPKKRKRVLDALKRGDTSILRKKGALPKSNEQEQIKEYLHAMKAKLHKIRDKLSQLAEETESINPGIISITFEPIFRELGELEKRTNNPAEDDEQLRLDCKQWAKDSSSAINSIVEKAGLEKYFEEYSKTS